MNLDMPMDTFMAYKLQQNHVKNVANHVFTWSASSTDVSTDADDKAEDDMRSRIIRDFHASKNACSHCGQNNYWCICDQSVLTPL